MAIVPGRQDSFQDIKAVLFDLDGTLIDSAPDLGAAADKMRIDRGLPSLPLQAYRPMAGAGARGMIGVAFGHGTEHPEYEALREEFFLNYEACMTERTYAFDGVPELLAELQGRGDQQVRTICPAADPADAFVQRLGDRGLRRHHAACQAAPGAAAGGRAATGPAASAVPVCGR